MGEVNYRQVCVDLFGTDDVEELRDIAAQVMRSNGKGGRKRKFSDAELEEIRRLRAQGMPAQAIAEKYHTSRQIITKYLSPAMDGSYTMRMSYMHGHSACTLIDVDFLHEKIRIQNQTPDILHRAFGAKENPDWNDFQQFLADRCFPATRGMLKEALADIGVSSYDPLQIIEKTKGRVADDDMWIKVKYRAVSQ